MPKINERVKVSPGSMGRFTCELSQQALLVVNQMASEMNNHRNPMIEDMLWANKHFKDAASKLGIERPVRRRRGRPSTKDLKALEGRPDAV